MNRNRCFVPSCTFFPGNEINRKFFSPEKESEKCNSMDACNNSTSGDRNLLIVLIFIEMNNIILFHEIIVRYK